MLTYLRLVDVVFDEILVFVFIDESAKSQCEVDIDNFMIFSFQLEVRIDRKVNNIQISKQNFSYLNH